MSTSRKTAPDSLIVAQGVETFKQSFVAHPKILDVRDQLMRVIDSFATVYIVMIVGPTGAGKTTLRKRMCDAILEKSGQQITEVHSHIPVAGIALDLSDPSKFNWRNDYYHPALKALNEPLIKYKVGFELEKLTDPVTGYTVIRRGMTQADYRSCLEAALIQRRPKAFWIDDAQLLTKVTVNQRFKDQIDSIKGFSEVTERNGIPKPIIHVLFGTYDMLPLVALSPELARRTRLIHLGRYHQDNEQDENDFADILKWLVDKMPLKRKPDLEKYTQYFFEQSLGCIGILKDRLTMALENALNNRSITLRPKHWEEGEMTQWELESMAAMIGDDEARFENKKANPSYPVMPEKRGNPRKRNKKPGQRNPKRDQFGG